MKRNVDLYPWYISLFGLTAWLPIFFLYFSQHLTLEQVLLLEAIYYAAVVLLEVPSGYFSDVIGRRITLLVSSTGMGLAYVLFIIGGTINSNTFAIFIAAQLLTAIGFAFKSGTDTSFHFDSLTALDQESEYADREAIAGRNGLLASTVAVLLGGLVALIDLRLAYVLSLLGMIGALWIVFRFEEPAQDPGHTQEGPVAQFLACVGYAGRPTLSWILAFVVLMTILNHVPYEFYQPYIDLLANNGNALFAGRTPLIAGIVMGISSLLGAWVAGRSIWIRDRIGLGPTFLTATAIQTVVITMMGSVLSALVVPLIMLRTLPHALTTAPMNAAIAPEVPQAQRATYFSMQSLAGRLAFSLTLLLLSRAAAGGSVEEWSTLGWMLRACAVLGVVGWIGLWVSRKKLGKVGNR